jgi:hypothetical protein
MILKILLILAILIVIFFCIYRVILKRRSDVVEYESVHLPWEIKSLDSIDYHRYEYPMPMQITPDLINKIENVIKLTPSANSIVQSEKRIIVKFVKNHLIS